MLLFSVHRNSKWVLYDQFSLQDYKKKIQSSSVVVRIWIASTDFATVLGSAATQIESAHRMLVVNAMVVTASSEYKINVTVCKVTTEKERTNNSIDRG